MQSEIMRRQMVDSQLRTSGVNVPWIIAAMGALPREIFVNADQGSTVYSDRPTPLGSGRMLNPALVAGQMLQAAAPTQNDAALLIGAGTGYLAALLRPRVATLVAVEADSSLAAVMRSNAPDMTIVEGALPDGAAQGAPYSLVIIDGAIAQLPDAIIDQMAEGGRIVCGVMDGTVGRLASGIKQGGQVVLRSFIDMDVAPLPGFARSAEFVF